MDLRELAADDPEAVATVVATADDPARIAAAIDALQGRVREDTLALDQVGTVADAVSTTTDGAVIRSGAGYFAAVGLEAPARLEPHAETLAGVLRVVVDGDPPHVETVEWALHDVAKALRTLAGERPAAVAPHAAALATALETGRPDHKGRKALLRALRAIVLPEHELDLDPGTLADGHVTAYGLDPTDHADAVVPHAPVVANVVAETSRTSTSEVGSSVLHGIATVDVDAVLPVLPTVVEWWSTRYGSGSPAQESLGVLRVVAAERPGVLVDYRADVARGVARYLTGLQEDQDGDHGTVSKRQWLALREGLGVLCAVVRTHPVQAAATLARVEDAAGSLDTVHPDSLTPLVETAGDLSDPWATAACLRILAAVAEGHPAAVRPHADAIAEIVAAAATDPVVEAGAALARAVERE